MRWFSEVEWRQLFVPQTPLLEIVMRGTVVYLALYALLPVVLKRQRGGISVTDLLVLVLIADAAQDAMAGDYRALPDGVLLVAVIIGWAALLDWLGYRFPLVQRLVPPGPLAQIHQGRLLRRNMAREFVTEGELMGQLRLQGVTDPRRVEVAYLEGDGRISVIQRNVDGQHAQGGGKAPWVRHGTAQTHSSEGVAPHRSLIVGVRARCCVPAAGARLATAESPQLAQRRTGAGRSRGPRSRRRHGGVGGA